MKHFLALFSLFVVSAAVASGASLRADSSSQLVQNERADADHLSRMEDEAMVERWARLELLHRVEAETRGYYLHAVRPELRYLRPWAHLFLSRLSDLHHSRFKKPLRVTSLLRTESYQRSLQRRNGNAAAATGPKRSAHLTGACMDISKKGMTGAQVAWMRRVLANLHEQGYLHAVEEFQQPVFHVMVHRSYVDFVEEKTQAD